MKARSLQRRPKTFAEKIAEAYILAGYRSSKRGVTHRAATLGLQSRRRGTKRGMRPATAGCKRPPCVPTEHMGLGA